MSAMKIIDDIKSRGGTVTCFSSVCGGLPAREAADNPLKLKYKFSWSPKGVHKTVSLDGFGSIDESLCTAMQNGFGRNGTLEHLKLSGVRMCDDIPAALWCGAFSFLRTNKALKSLTVHVNNNVRESCVSTLRGDIACMVQENASLESLSVFSWNKVQADEYVLLITALQRNTTLKTLRFHNSTIRLTDDEDKQMAILLKKNSALERPPDINQGGDMGAILRLNEAGRRYLIQDGSSILKGVDVLSRVNNDINCVFLHLLENPRLCDRSAVEKMSAGKSDGSSTNRGNQD
jgi:hypothetical protein